MVATRSIGSAHWPGPSSGQAHSLVARTARPEPRSFRRAGHGGSTLYRRYTGHREHLRSRFELRAGVQCAEHWMGCCGGAGCLEVVPVHARRLRDGRYDDDPPGSRLPPPMHARHGCTPVTQQPRMPRGQAARPPQGSDERDKLSPPTNPICSDTPSMQRDPLKPATPCARADPDSARPPLPASDPRIQACRAALAGRRCRKL